MTAASKRVFDADRDSEFVASKRFRSEPSTVRTTLNATTSSSNSPSDPSENVKGSVNTKILPTKMSSIKFAEDLDLASAYDTVAESTQASLRHIETCKPLISSPETLASLLTARHHLITNLQPIVLPTETVCGLGAVALQPDAVARIFEINGTPTDKDNPLIVYVSSLEMLKRDVLPSGYTIPTVYRRLMAKFWPGSLTLVFPFAEAEEGTARTGGRKRGLPRIVTVGRSTVAVRMPANPVARALIALVDAPIAAPSSKTSARPSPRQTHDVFRDYSGKVGIILDDSGIGDGWGTSVGITPSVLDFSTSQPSSIPLQPSSLSRTLPSISPTSEAPSNLKEPGLEKDRASVPARMALCVDLPRASRTLSQIEVARAWEMLRRNLSFEVRPPRQKKWMGF